MTEQEPLENKKSDNEIKFIDYWQKNLITQYIEANKNAETKWVGSPFRLFNLFLSFFALPIAFSSTYILLLKTPSMQGLIIMLLGMMGSIVLSSYLVGKYCPRNFIFLKEHNQLMDNITEAIKIRDSIKEQLDILLDNPLSQYEIILSLDKARVLCESNKKEFLTFSIEKIKHELILSFMKKDKDSIFNALLKLPNIEHELKNDWNEYVKIKEDEKAMASFIKDYENYLLDSGEITRLNSEKLNRFI